MKLALATTLGLLLVAGPAGPEDPVKVDFAALSGFDYEEGMELPAEVTAYNEKVVVVSGFMRREDEAVLYGTGREDVEYFMLVNDSCGCEGTPKLNEIVFCAMPEGQTTEILPGIVEVTGTMYVGEEKEDDVVLALYTMDVDSISSSSAPSARADARESR